MGRERIARPGRVQTIALGAVAVLGLAGLVASPWRTHEPEPGDRVATDVPPDPTPTLYCEFNNFADRTPLVGFYFRRAGNRQVPTYTLIDRRDGDGSRIAAGGPGLSARPWAFERSGESASLASPDDDTAINLYGDDHGGPGMGWFEAGLRSIRYRNLGGRCRHGT